MKNNSEWNKPIAIPIPSCTKAKSERQVLKTSKTPKLVKSMSLGDTALSDTVEYSDYLSACILKTHVDGRSRKTVYQVDVQLDKQNWTVTRRYSDFRRLKRRLIKQLVKEQCSNCTICQWVLDGLQTHPFPPRRPFSSSQAVTNLRQKVLNQFLEKLLSYVQMMRQYSSMFSNELCSTLSCINMIEEFLRVEFTKYLEFLNDRGIID